MHKYFYSFLLSLVLLSSCSDNKSSEPNVTINGKFTANPTDKVYLNKFIDSIGRYVAIDSVDVTASGDEKSYTFQTHIDSVEFIIITHNNSEKVIELIPTKNETITIEYDGNNLPYSVNISGSEQSLSAVAALNLVSKFEEQKQKATQQLNDVGYTDTVARKNIIRDFEVIRSKFNDEKNKLFNMYPNSLGLYVLLPYLNYEEELNQIQKIEQNFRAQVNNTSWHNYVKKVLDQANNYIIQKERFALEQKRQEEIANMLAIGSVAPEISLPDLNGNYKSLSELRGQVVLIDFWASWCRPCRMENPNLVKAYEKYKSKGFTVFSVSLDNDRARWESAINQDGLKWEHHVSDLMGWQTSIGPTYGINSIPFAVLIDKDGNIIAKNLRGDQLEQKLKEILG